MGRLIEDIFHAAFDNAWLRAGNDQSAFDVAAGRMVMTTDAYVVTPLFFPGGDIGSLAVHGTINDVAMAGARPLYLTASFVIEEGLPSPTSPASPAAWAMRRATPERRSSPVTPRSSSGARRTGCSSRPPASVSCRLVLRYRATRRGPAIIVLLSARSATMASRLSKRENLGVRDRDLVGPGRTAWPRRGNRRGGGAVATGDARLDAGRSRRHAERACPPIWPGISCLKRPRSRSGRRLRRLMNSSASTRSTSPTKASLSQSLRRRARKPRSR